MITIDKLTKKHATEGSDQRLGQWSCNTYLKDSQSIPGLYYEENDKKSTELIRSWLIANQYIDQLPQKVITE